MKAKDIKAGMIVGVLTTGRLETYSRVDRYEVIDVGPWEEVPHSAFYASRQTYSAPEGLTLPEGVEWPEHLEVRKVDSYRSDASTFRRARRGVLVVGREEGHYNNGKVGVFAPRKIRGEYDAVAAEVKSVRDAADAERKRLTEAQDRADARRAALEARLKSVMEAEFGRSPMLRGRGHDVTVTLATFDDLLHLAEKGRDA